MDALFKVHMYTLQSIAYNFEDYGCEGGCKNYVIACVCRCVSLPVFGLQSHSIREQRGTHKRGKEWRLVIHGPAKR